MSLNVHQSSDSADVVSTGDVADLSRLVLVPSDDLSLF